MHRVDSPKFGPNMWEVSDVPNRTHILIHVANTSNNVLGCIGLGTSLYGDLAGVGNSRRAINEFYELTGGMQKMELEIVKGVIE